MCQRWWLNDFDMGWLLSKSRRVSQCFSGVVESKLDTCLNYNVRLVGMVNWLDVVLGLDSFSTRVQFNFSRAENADFWTRKWVEMSYDMIQQVKSCWQSRWKEHFAKIRWFSQVLKLCFDSFVNWVMVAGRLSLIKFIYFKLQETTFWTSLIVKVPRDNDIYIYIHTNISIDIYRHTPKQPFQDGIKNSSLLLRVFLDSPWKIYMYITSKITPFKKGTSSSKPPFLCSSR